MNILHTVESYCPEVSGMSKVVQQLSERLVKLGHNVTVATTKESKRKSKKYINGVKIIEFNIWGKSAFKVFGETKKYQDFLVNSSFDIVTNFAAQQWATDLMLPMMGKMRAKKVFVPTGFSGLYSPLYQNYYQNMKKWMKEYDMNIFLSNNYQDINFARKNNIKNITVIPNGASKEEFLSNSKINIRKKLGIPDNHFLVLNVSSHTGKKGHTETIKIFNKANIKNSTLLIIGKRSNLLRGCYLKCQLAKLIGSKNILIKDLLREETVGAFKTADIFLFTSKIECSPLVLFESMAAKLPFLTTNTGNAKEIIKWSRGGKLLPNDINKSAKILKKCHLNPSKLKKLGKDGHKAWLNKFTWEEIALQYENIYKKI